MHAAIDAYHAMHPYGGIARYIHSLVGEMAAQAPDDRFLLFANRFCEKGGMWRPQAQNVEAVTLNAPRRMMQWMWDHLDWPPVERWTGTIDVFHGTHFVLPAVHRARTVLTVHDLTWLRHPDFFKDQTLNERGYRHELPRALERADAVVAVSHATRNDLVELMNVDAARVQVVHEGVEAHFFVPEGDPRIDAIRRQYRLPDRYLVFLVGTPEPRKNLLRTVQAVQLAAPGLTLVIIGDREKLASLLGPLAASVHLAGYVPDDVLPLMLAGAEAALYPSLYEGFGLPVLEAMAAGTPVITSNISACPEVAGDAGLCVDPYDIEAMADAVRRLVEDEALRLRMRGAGRKRAAELTWDRAAERMLRLYHSLV